MSDLTLEEYIRYRLSLAEETYEVALLLVENEKWNSAVNRFYYACFYAVSALLARSQIQSRSHTGVKTQFFLNYIKEDRFEKELGKLYSDLFDWRHRGDYADFVDFKSHQVLPLVESVREFLDQIQVEILNK